MDPERGLRIPQRIEVILEKAQKIAQSLYGEIVLPMQLPQHAAPPPEPDYSGAVVSDNDLLLKVWDRLNRAEQETYTILRQAGDSGIHSRDLRQRLSDANISTDTPQIIHRLKSTLRKFHLELAIENTNERKRKKGGHYRFKHLPPEPPSPHPAVLPLTSPLEPGGGSAADPTVRAEKIHGGHPASGELAENTMKLAKFIALKEFAKRRNSLPRDMDADDLVALGYEGLLDAARRYDPKKGSFSQYASVKVTGNIVDAVRNSRFLPRPIIDRFALINGVEDKLRQQLGRKPTLTEIASESGLTVSQIRDNLQAVTEGMHILSLDSPAHRTEDTDNGNPVDTLADVIPADSSYEPENNVIDQELRNWLKRSVHSLSDRDQLVLSLHYDRGLTMQEIACILHVSDARVGQLHSRAVERLRERAKHAQLVI